MDKYDSYKSSSYDWLGEIPSHWEEKFLEQTASEKCVKNIGNTVTQVLSLSYGEIKKKSNLNKGLIAQDLSTYQIIEPGDIIMRLTDLQNDHKSLRTGLVKDDGIITAAYLLVFLAVKPQMYPSVIEQIRDHVRKETVVISIAPGKSIEWLCGLFQRDVQEMKLVRCMPNTPALVMEGCTGVCFAEAVTADEKEAVMKILNSFGRADEVAENLMDTVVGVSGSSPAYVFMFIEAMADAAVADGMPRKLAYEFAAQSVLGSAKMVLETGMHPAQLKDMVCSPGGTTIEAVRILEQKGLRSSVIEAQKACVEKSRNM